MITRPDKNEEGICQKTAGTDACSCEHCRTTHLHRIWKQAGPRVQKGGLNGHFSGDSDAEHRPLIRGPRT